MAQKFISIDTDSTVKATLRRLDEIPGRMEKARTRALRKLGTWVQRQVLRMVASSAGTTQKRIKNMKRVAVNLGGGGLIVWMGTQPIAVHKLGNVKWTRRMKGARVGRKLYPGSWSHGEGSKTGAAVMERRSETRLPLDRVEAEVHDDVRRGLDSLLPEIADRYKKLMAQELNYALRHEARS